MSELSKNLDALWDAASSSHPAGEEEYSIYLKLKAELDRAIAQAKMELIKDIAANITKIKRCTPFDNGTIYGDETEYMPAFEVIKAIKAVASTT